MAEARKKKYFVETSAVPAAIAASTSLHRQHYAEFVEDGQEWTSIYIRKEFIWAFFCELAYAAFFISQRTSVQDALVLLSNRFSIRAIKVDMIALGALLEQKSAMHSPDVAAEELGSLAIRWLKTFDRIFRERIPNEVGCRIGLKQPKIDYDTMMKDLNEFYVDFTEPVDDCPVNDFVGMGNPLGRGQRLVQEKTTQSLDSVVEIAKLLGKGTRFVSNDCKKIGDALIALEQPEDSCLIHVDNAYDQFCGFLQRQHKKLKSAHALDKAEMAAKAKASAP